LRDKREMLQRIWSIPASAVVNVGADSMNAPEHPSIRLEFPTDIRCWALVLFIRRNASAARSTKRAIHISRSKQTPVCHERVQALEAMFVIA